MKFIKLHNKETNSVIVINTEKIVLVDTTEDGDTIISMEGDVFEDFTVNESAERIYNMLIEKDNKVNE